MIIRIKRREREKNKKVSVFPLLQLRNSVTNSVYILQQSPLSVMGYLKVSGKLADEKRCYLNLKEEYRKNEDKKDM